MALDNHDRSPEAASRALREEIENFSGKNGYLATQFADARCACGGVIFRLHVDDTEGAAVRECVSCGLEHAMGDSAEYLDEAELEECECPCGGESLQVTVGVALYEESDDVRWLYIGGHCSKCGLSAVYADWKNEFEDYRKLLTMI